MSQISRERAAFQAQLRLRDKNLRDAGRDTMPVRVILNWVPLGEPINVPIGAAPPAIERIVVRHPEVAAAIRCAGRRTITMSYNPVPIPAIFSVTT